MTYFVPTARSTGLAPIPRQRAEQREKRIGDGIPHSLKLVEVPSDGVANVVASNQVREPGRAQLCQCPAEVPSSAFQIRRIGKAGPIDRGQ